MKWIILAMKAEDRLYYKVGEIEMDTDDLYKYGEVVQKAYQMQGDGSLTIPFHWCTIYAVPDKQKYRHIYVV